ncbi:MAG TPA: hypothetical protein VGT41_06830 [Candidatus Babeliales bacterium]|nr:hypothetical protein [Candidatus Babeliales bacterium]
MFVPRICIAIIVAFFLANNVSVEKKVDNLTEQVVRQKKVRGGYVLADLLTYGVSAYLKDKTEQEHLEDICSLIWYLDAIASISGQQVAEGMYVLQDANSVVFNFLFRYSKVYQRISSHFKEYYTPHYGIDIPKELRERLLLPHNNHHILFGLLPNGYMFIEPEGYGLRYLSDRFAHLRDYLRYVIKKRYKPSLLDAATARHEVIPHAVAMRWREVIAQLCRDTSCMRQYENLGLTFGIKKMREIVHDLSKKKKLNNLQQQAIQRFDAALVGYNYLDVRRGREVIFMQHDLVD